MAGTFVWPLAIRIGHWLLVGTTVTSWLTRHAEGVWHEWLGYAVLVVVVWRVVTGVLGEAPYAFNSFVVSPTKTLIYLRQLPGSSASPNAGHNPLGAWMVMTLLMFLTLVSFTGWLYTTDRFWGVEWVGNAHTLSSDLLIAAVVLHISGVLFASWRERQNLIAAMIHGRKSEAR